MTTNSLPGDFGLPDWIIVRRVQPVPFLVPEPGDGPRTAMYQFQSSKKQTRRRDEWKEAERDREVVLRRSPRKAQLTRIRPPKRETLEAARLGRE